MNNDRLAPVRKIAMTADKAPLVNKLILVVLVLILGCLVALVVQNGRKDQSRNEQPVEVANETTESPETRQPEPVSYLPVTNRALPKRSVTNPARPSLAGMNQPSGVTPEERVDADGRIANPIFADTRGPAGAVVVAAGRGVFGSAQISGEVWLSGKPPAETPIRFEGTTCGSLHPEPLTTRHYVVTKDGRLANVFVYVKEGLQSVKFPNPVDQPALENINCQFDPYVMGVQVGQKFSLVNSDPVLHNVNASPKLNHGFNLSLTRDQRVAERSFSVPEVLVRLKCDVHPWMFAYIGVLPHPFFAVTDDEGGFRFPPGLPPGRYLIAGVHLKAGETTQEITIGEHEAKVLRFDLAVPKSQSR